MKKRGIFKSTVTRASAPADGAAPKPRKAELSPEAIEEIEFRFAGLKPYLSPSS